MQLANIFDQCLIFQKENQIILCDSFLICLESERGEKSVCIQLEDIECELVFIDRPRTEISVSSFLIRDRTDILEKRDRTDILYQRKEIGRIYQRKEIGRIYYIREKRQTDTLQNRKKRQNRYYRVGIIKIKWKKYSKQPRAIFNLIALYLYC